MSNCPDCGGSDGNHFDDCPYEGTGGGYSGGPGGVFCIQILVGIAILLALKFPILGLIMFVVLTWRVITGGGKHT